MKRQQDFLRHEFLPISHMRKSSGEGHFKTILIPTGRLLVRYIAAKSHKDPGATRDTTACCESRMDKIARVVNVCVVLNLGL